MKIGIVGRTGAGKSSLSMALFRLIEDENTLGDIVIDGVRSRDVGLHDLRQRMTIIPQEPVVFSGSLRFNLDPFDAHADDELWSALDKVHLKEYVKTLDGQLLFECDEFGDNLRFVDITTTTLLHIQSTHVYTDEYMCGSKTMFSVKL